MFTECLEEQVEEKGVEESCISKCMNQRFPPRQHLRAVGYGNCLKCIPNSNNKFCKGYRPANIKIRSFDVKESLVEAVPQEVSGQDYF